MKNYFLITAMTGSLLVSSCGGDDKSENRTPVNRQDLINIIKSGEKELYASMQVDNVKGNMMIANYIDFANNFPKDTLTPVFLFKAAEVATATEQYPQALEYYKRITDNFPDYTLYQESLYLQAYLLDNFINDDAQAKAVYEQVIQKYPDSNFAKDSKDAINNLGKTDEELIREFEKKNEQKNS